MKKNNTKKNNTARKLLPAAGMLAVSASMLATSTYAWFTMNKQVTVTGMQLKTKVGSNLLICDDNVEANYSTVNLNQGRAALLEPVSSVDGTTGSFWYTTDAKADGDAASEVYSPYSETLSLTNTNAGKSMVCKAFNDAYTISGTGTGSGEGDALFTSKITAENMSGLVAPAYGYVDYVFYIKATSDAADQEIAMTECNLLRANAAITNDTYDVDDDLAWRVAVFADNITSAGGKGTTASFTPSGGSATTVGAIDPAGSGKAAKAILTLENSRNQSNKDGSGDPQAITAANGGLTDVSYNTWDSANLISMGAAGSTAYIKVTVRVWLEGEDTTCKSSTYALLTSEYELAAKFELVASDGSGVANIQSDTSKVGYVTP